ncbi:hypothetical protein MEG1DRAFT_01033 [Photorhabdus temperata subsp. temperata Meg1]|uniref:Uncharacterized protein n=1 Tax=Photorhabdus temperata subsp. temperata Meg1 TaxID=1393735 RepID=A0A081S010_PHOTE|nr:hypothetical protein MEG1DRAFT_01033 [Photorhabdus temperata subsp. temperata Meg1]
MSQRSTPLTRVTSFLLIYLTAVYPPHPAIAAGSHLLFPVYISSFFRVSFSAANNFSVLDLISSFAGVILFNIELHCITPSLA